MAISTYTELQAALANWLDREDLTSRAPEFVALAEAKISRRLRARSMQAVSTATVSTEMLALPTDFAAVIDLSLTRNGVTTSLRPTDTAAIAATETPDTITGWPECYAIVGASAQLYPVPDATYTAALTYIQRVPALSVAAPTNWLLVLAPDVYLYGALMEAALYLRDTDLFSTAKPFFEEALMDLSRDQKKIIGPLRTEVSVMAGRESYNINRGW